MTPEERLCSRAWRLRNSAWVLYSILSFAFLNWAGFLQIGIKAKNKAWLIWAATWGVIAIALCIGFSVIDTGTKEAPITSTAGNILSAVFVLTWIAGIGQAIIVNRSWLRWRAHHPKSETAWYATGHTPVQPPPPAHMNVDDMLRGQQIALNVAQPGPPQTAGQSSAPPVVLNLNTATSGEMQAQLGLDQAWSDWIISTRDRIGAFTSTDQLLTEASMPPHIYMGLRDKVKASPTAAKISRPASEGRRLEL